MAKYPWLEETAAPTVNRSYFPEDPLPGIREHENDSAWTAEYVPSGYACPDYSVLDESQLRYYLWWRHMVDRGVLDKSDEGYAWLRARELIASRDDPAEVLPRVIAYAFTCRSSLRLRPMFTTFVSDYMLAKGLPPDSVPRSKHFACPEWLATWDLTRYPIRRTFPGYLLSGPVVDHRKYTSVRIETMEDIVLKSLQGIDEIVRSESGMGLVRFLGCEVETCPVIPLEAFLRKREAIRMPSVDVTSGPLFQLIDAVMRQACRFLKDPDSRGPMVPATFPVQYRKVVAAAVDAVMEEGVWDATIFRKSIDGYWGDDDLPVDEQERPKPKVMPLYNVPFEKPRITFREIMQNWGRSESAEPAYVPSNRLSASYSSMDDGQSDYYFAWRTRARQGDFRDTDSGYLWLFCVEVVNIDDDPAGIQELLEGAMYAYGESAPSFLRSCARDHAMLHGMDIPPEAVGWDKRYAAFAKLSSDPVGRFDIPLAEELSGYSSDRYTSDNPGLYAEAFTRSVRAVDNLLRTKNSRIIARGPRNRYPVKMLLYRDVWMPKTVTVELLYADVLSSKRITDLMAGIFKTTIRSVNRVFGRNAPRAHPDFPDTFLEVVERAVDDLLDELEGRQREERARKETDSIVIDRAAVDSARRDLRVVTELMAVEEEEDAPAAEEETAVQSGWAGLVASLDEAETAYLRDSVTERGAGTWSLQGTGRRPQAVEDSVNSKAMDAIGDAIMEGGRAFEDYVDEIRGVLRWPYRRGHSPL